MPGMGDLRALEAHMPNGSNGGGAWVPSPAAPPTQWTWTDTIISSIPIIGPAWTIKRVGDKLQEADRNGGTTPPPVPPAAPDLSRYLLIGGVILAGVMLLSAIGKVVRKWL